MNTVRFTQVVEECGRPHVHTLWVAPEKDSEFMRAHKAGRVMTITQSGGKTDVGIVGFNPKATITGQFLVFPKSLRRFEGARVVGIKFDLVDQPKPVVASTELAASRAKPPPRSHSRAHRTPQPHDPAAPHDKPVGASENDPGAGGDEPPAPPPKRATQRKRPPTHSAGTKSATAAKSAPAGKPAKSHPILRSASPLLREVRAAMEELEKGNSVAAYRRLERAVKAAESNSG